MNVRSKLFIGFLFLSGLVAPLLVAQGATTRESAEDFGEDVTESAEDLVDSFDGLGCASKYYSFILTVRNENTREQFVQDFRRGFCQLNDIMELDDELDTVRENFRSAAFNCSDTAAYKEDYKRILMEQYFIRNVQKSRSDVIREKEAAAFDAAKEEVLTALKAEMKDIFVDGSNAYFSESDFNDTFDSWVLKYEDRIGNYNQCEEGGFAEIKDEWDDFMDTINSLGEGLDIDEGDPLSFKDNRNVGTNFDQGVDQVKDIGKSVLKSYEYYKNILNLGNIDVEAPVEVGDFSGSGGSYSFGTVLETIEKDNIRVIIQSESVERMAKYKLLYGEGGAVAATDMQGILQYMNQITSETNIKDFPTILKDVEIVYDRQCK